LQVSLDQKQLNYNISQASLEKQRQDIITKTKELSNLEKDQDNQIKRKNSQIEVIAEKIDVLKKQLTDIQD
jgi:lipid II:glycine glycyltransferase (peptidoglycan interpeptide bridge formation enzyme)